MTALTERVASSMLQRPWPALRRALAAAAFLAAGNAAAHMSLPVLSGSSGWEASLDGVHWQSTAAYGNYPNPITRPSVIYNGTGPDPLPERASLMWYWGAGPYTGVPTGANGPTKAYFRYRFDVPELTGGPAIARFAADDDMILKFNGHQVGSYHLDDHKVNGQPVLVDTPDLTPFLNTFDPFIVPSGAFIGDGTIHNEFVIEASDLGLYEYVFLDAEHFSNSYTVALVAVPEPGTLLLLFTGLVLLVLAVERRRFDPGSSSTAA